MATITPIPIFTIYQHPEFVKWLRNIKDSMVRRRLAVRLRKATLGNLGDTKSVGGGVYEMRETFGAGWRMYYVQQGEVVIIMLGGGNKSKQSEDIARAIARAETLRENER